MPPSVPTPITPTRWALALSGLGLVVFAVVALTGPGRIDIEDGQTRFEAGRSLVEHGDTAIRDPRVPWFRLPGRNGLEYTLYRFPQEVIAAGCILLADATGPASEAWRHYIFSLHGTVIAALLAILYAVWFRRQGLSPHAAIAWAAGGIFCTPNWFYATSTFDDALGSLVVVAALVVANAARSGGWWRVVLAAALVGLALNCKPPLAAFLLPAAVLIDNPARPRWSRLSRVLVLVLGAIVGYAVYTGYEQWKFPPETRAAHAEILARDYAPVFFGNPVEAMIDYAVGPSGGSVWYCPTLVLMAAGLFAWRAAGHTRVAVSMALAAAAFIGFCSLLTFYKGGVCWGPRYLTPVFAAGWLFAPAGVAAVGVKGTRMLLVAGVVVQILGLAVVPERLYFERKVPSGYFLVDPWLSLRPELSHLLDRPREVMDAVTAPPAPYFTPGPSPTFTMPILEPPFYTGEKGLGGVRQYTLLNNLRPWWATYPHLSPDQRPVDLGTVGLVFGGIAAIGLGLLALGIASRGPQRSRPIR